MTRAPISETPRRSASCCRSFTKHAPIAISRRSPPEKP
jgi:hypothetical protein